MSNVYTRIGYIKGDTGAQGAQGAQGDTGDAATIQVGSVTTVPYGQTANVVNSGTEQAAVFDFTIPQGRPGQQTTEMDNLLLNSITTSAASFPIPAVGETGKVLWGKVTKWFSDMSALVASKLDAANVVNNLTTTSSGYALDARQGKALNDMLGVTANESPTYAAVNSGITIHAMSCVKCGHLLFVTMQFSLSAAVAHNASLFTLSGYGHPVTGGNISILTSNTDQSAHIRPSATGQASIIFGANGGIPAGGYYNGTAIVFVQ